MQEHPVILFDGVCNLCHRSIQFIIRHDRRGRFRFASLQSQSAAALLNARPDAAAPAALQAPLPAPLPDSMVLLERGRTYTQSTAMLRIVRGLRWPLPLAYALIIIPKPLRDWAYSIIARNRYHWFGRRESCSIASPEQLDRFLS
jgi:predicted DCC family thiol-disulfide oxidoreductase YuxK